MTARPRGLRRVALAAGVLGIGMSAAVPSAAYGQTQDGGSTAAPADRETVTVNARRDRLSGKRAKFGGRLSSGDRGRTVYVQKRVGKRYKTIARAKTRKGGRYAAYWRTKGTGRLIIRAFVHGKNGARPAAKRLKGRLTIYRPRHASYYGPGLYGNRLACGGRLSRGTVGVAHKSLPCGTKVTFHNKGRTLTVKVIDRGPYVRGRVYDLTAATKNKLRFGSTGTVWATK